MNAKNKIIVLYVLLPLFVLSFALPALNSLTTFTTATPNFITLKSVSVMSRDTSDAINDVHLSSVAAFDTYNDWYADSDTVSVYERLNSAVTYSRFKSDIRYRDRVQIVSHGSYTSSSGPVVDLYGSTDLKTSTSRFWGTSYGTCELVLLASCYSFGSNNLDRRLADAILQKTPAKAVIGFKGAAELFATTFLVSNFWWQHMAGLQYNGDYYGYGAETAYSRSIWLLESLLADAKFTANLVISAILAYFTGPLVFTVKGIMTKILQTIFKNGITEAAFNLFVSNVVATMNGFIYYSNGDYIGSLVSGGGSGGGSGPIDTID